MSILILSYTPYFGSSRAVLHSSNTSTRGKPSIGKGFAGNLPEFLELVDRFEDTIKLLRKINESALKLDFRESIVLERRIPNE